MTATTGRTLASATVARRLRRTFNPFAQQLAERVLAKALAGDPQALSAATALLLAANGLQDPAVAVPRKLRA